MLSASGSWARARSSPICPRRAVCRGGRRDPGCRARSREWRGIAGSGPGLGVARERVGPARRQRSPSRSSWLRRSSELGLDERVVVDHRRAELAGRDADRRGRMDVVVARAFGPPVGGRRMRGAVSGARGTARGERASRKPPIVGPRRSGCVGPGTGSLGPSRFRPLPPDRAVSGSLSPPRRRPGQAAPVFRGAVLGARF